MKVSDQFGTPFDYTEAEWSKIRESVQAICTLTEEERADLRADFGPRVLSVLASMSHNRTVQRQWRKAGREFEKLRKTLSVAVEARHLTGCGLSKGQVADAEHCFRDVFSRSPKCTTMRRGNSGNSGQGVSLKIKCIPIRA